MTYSDETTIKELNGVALTYSNGDVCPATGGKYSFTVNIYCDEDIETIDYTGLVYGPECAPFVNLISKQGCSVFDANVIWDFLADYEDFWGVFMILGGLILNFLGRKLLKPSICMAGMCSTIIISVLVFYTAFFDSDTDLDTFWYVLGGSAVAGLLIGLLLAKFVKVGAAVLAGWGGFAAGLVLNEVVIAQLKLEWLFWVSMVACVLVAVILTFFIFDHVIILSTVAVGSYGMMRGISMYAGHYYNEVTMAKLISQGLLEDIDPWYWAYIGAFAVFFLIGACV